MARQDYIPNDWEVILPEQFMGASKLADNGEPEKRLMFAVLCDAIICFQARDGREKEAERWISGDDEDSPFSFNYVCEALGFESNNLRKGLFSQRYRQPPASTDVAPSMPRRHHTRKSVYLTNNKD